ncbi:MAG: hypothetical protein JW798_11335 [Prolixibacteraceae bacterium]|nr:hypothetical protein [Prolixibacteraceae bacterium]
MAKKVTKLLLRLLLLGMPFILMIALYLVTDPFKVIHHYSCYYQSGKYEPVVLNRDFVSFETFENQYPEYRYDSFIFGSSRTFFYRVSDWQKYISSDRCFHFNASAESLYGIYQKIKYLDKNHIPIKNALIGIDYSVLKKTDDSKGILFMKHPELSGKSHISFQIEFIKAFFDKDFFWNYLKYLFLKVKPYPPMYHIWNYELKYNELQNEYAEQLISKNKDEYFRNLKRHYNKRDTLQKESPPAISGNQEMMLNEMQTIFQKNNCNCKIIIHPLWNQIKLNPDDLAKLQEIFGKENVFDFSGINSITGNLFNYYDLSHYRPETADSLLREIYHFKTN